MAFHTALRTISEAFKISSIDSALNEANEP